MTDIRELLREATDDLTIDDTDPVGRVRRGTARRRRTWTATIAVAAAVVVVLAVAVPLATRTSSQVLHGPEITHPSPAVVQTWEPDDGEVAGGLGAVWGLECCGTIAGRSWVDKLEPTTGERIKRISVPSPTSTIGVGAGRVWVIGANAGGGGPSSITAINPASYRVQTLHISNQQAEPYAIAFAAGSAWVTIPDLDQVWRLTASATGIAKSVISVGGEPWTIATTGNGAIWVQQQSSNHLTHIAPTARSGRLGQSVPWRSRIYGAFGATSLIAADASGAAGSLDPSVLAGCDACAQSDSMAAKGQLLAAVRTARGVFVSTTRRTYFYSAYNLAHFGNGFANASVPDQGGSLAADGRGVVIGAGAAGLTRWIPADSGHSDGRPR